MSFMQNGSFHKRNQNVIALPKGAAPAPPPPSSTFSLFHLDNLAQGDSIGKPWTLRAPPIAFGVPAKFDSAMQLSTISSGYDLNSALAAELWPPDNPLGVTVEFWLRSALADTGGGFFITLNDFDDLGSWYVSAFNNGLGNLVFEGAADSLGSFVQLIIANDSQFHACAWVHDGSEARLYVDGVLVDTQIGSFDPRIIIGARFQANSNGADSQLDELRLTAEVLYTGASYTLQVAPFPPP